MNENDPFALLAHTLWVRDVSTTRLPEQRLVELEFLVQDLPLRTLTALVLPEGNPLVLDLSESLARDLRKALESCVASRNGAPPHRHDVMPQPFDTLITPTPASGYGPEGTLLGYEIRRFDVCGSTIEGCLDENGDRFVRFEVFVRDLPEGRPLALLLPEGSPLTLQLSETLASEMWKGLIDTEWWGVAADLC